MKSLPRRRKSSAVVEGVHRAVNADLICECSGGVCGKIRERGVFHLRDPRKPVLFRKVQPFSTPNQGSRQYLGMDSEKTHEASPYIDR